MQLGQEVLNKISDLLVEIDRPKSPKRKPKRQQAVIQERPNTSYNNDNRLYDNYKIIRTKAHQRQKDRIKVQMEKMQHFRVQNKHSIFLNSRKQLKPLHQRAADVLREKQLSIQKKRTQITLQKQRRKQIEVDSEEQALQQAKKSQRIVSKQQLQQIIKRMSQRDRERMQKNNRQKMDYLKQKLMNNMQKPSLNKKSQKIWQKVRMQRQLSPNVFERFDRYNWDRKKNHENYINKIKQKQTPFKPSISKKSIQILNKSSTSRLQLCKDLERTRSCKCFSKHNVAQKTFNNTSRYHNASNHIKSQANLSPNK